MPPRARQKVPQYRRTFVRQWRDFRGLSQDQLVARVLERLETFSKSTLSRIENAQQPYSQPIIEALAWALSCEPQDLIMRDPKSEAWSIWDSIRQMSAEDQEQVARIVGTFRKAS